VGDDEGVDRELEGRVSELADDEGSERREELVVPQDVSHAPMFPMMSVERDAQEKEVDEVEDDTAAAPLWAKKRPSVLLGVCATCTPVRLPSKFAAARWRASTREARNVVTR
jgi:hypothetical protein